MQVISLVNIHPYWLHHIIEAQHLPPVFTIDPFLHSVAIEGNTSGTVTDLEGHSCVESEMSTDAEEVMYLLCSHCEVNFCH